jgi:hypothetical protein
MSAEACPRFARCSVNRCPLHPAYPDLDTADGDAEKRCTLGKAPRLRLGAGLRYEGLTVTEWKYRKNWLARTPEQKAKTLAGLQKRSPGRAPGESESKTASQQGVSA